MEIILNTSRVWMYALNIVQWPMLNLKIESAITQSYHIFIINFYMREKKDFLSVSRRSETELTEYKKRKKEMFALFR